MVCGRVMILCFTVNFLLLLGTDRLFGCRSFLGNMLLGSAVAALYGGVCLLRGTALLGSWGIRLLVIIAIGIISFGIDIRAAKRTGVYVVISILLGGIGIHGVRGALPASVLIVLISTAAGCTRFMPLEIRHGGKYLCLTALRDTGNLLRDPVSGSSVLVIAQQAAGELTGLTQEQLASPLQTMTDSALPGLRLVPYQTVGKERGLLLAMRFPEVILGGQRKEVLVAFSPASFGGGVYQALAGGI